MEWSLVTDGLIVLGFVITGWFQKKQIDALQQNVLSLEKTITAQDKLISDMERAVHVIDIEKYSKHIKVFEELVEANAIKKMEVVERQFNEKHSDTKANLHKVAGYASELSRMAIHMFFYVHPDHRKQLIAQNLESPLFRDSFLKSLDEIREIWISPPDSALSFALKVAALQKQDESSGQKSLQSSVT